MDVRMSRDQEEGDPTDGRGGRNRGSDGLHALFESRRDADLAVEHLVQDHGLDRSEIFVEPAGATSTTGTRLAGADAPSGAPSSGGRRDAPLQGEIRLTVPITDGNRAAIEAALRETGARAISPV